MLECSAAHTLVIIFKKKLISSAHLVSYTGDFEIFISSFGLFFEVWTYIQLPTQHLQLDI